MGDPVNISARLAACAENRRKSVALIDSMGSLTVGCLWDGVADLAQALRKEGLAEGQCVGVMLRNGREFVITAFAAAATGAVVVPIWRELKQSDLIATVQESGISLIFDDVETTALPLKGPSRVVSIPHGHPIRMTRLNSGMDAPWIQSFEAPAFVRFTSGTTGPMKGAVLSHSDIWLRIESANQGLNLTEQDSVLWVFPMAFHFFVSIALYLRYGVRMIVCPSDTAPDMLGWANRFEVTHLYGGPNHFRALLDYEGAARIPSLTSAVSTSRGLSSQTVLAFADRMGVPISQAYGVIEVGLPMVNRRSLAKPASVGPISPAFRGAIFDDAGVPLGPGETGELGFQGPGLFSGYCNPPSLRTEDERNGWWMTGDMATMDEDGDVTVRGRKVTMIRLESGCIYPEEIQAALEGHPCVVRARVRMRRIGDAPPQLCGDIVWRGTTTPDDGKLLCDFLRNLLSHEQIPPIWRFVDSVAETPSGKVMALDSDE